MPELSLAVLRQLVAAAAQAPQGLHLAHDGRRLQPGLITGAGLAVAAVLCLGGLLVLMGVKP